MTWSVTQLGCRDSYLFSYEFFSCWGTRGSPATRQLLCVDRGADAQGQVPVDRGPLRLLSRGRALYQHSHVLCRDGWHRSHVAGDRCGFTKHGHRCGTWEACTGRGTLTPAPS